MLFNSIEFVFFLPIVFLLYWTFFSSNLKKRNVFLVIVSCVFYGWWDWRFLYLIFLSIFFDFHIAKIIDKTQTPKYRKFLLLCSVGLNLGLLGIFKYLNFFIESFNDIFALTHTNHSFNTLNIILPVGISFYTFQTISYSIDVYKRKLKPVRSFIDFAAYVSFFPQLVAGPIERATNLMPQMLSPVKFDSSEAIYGLRLILWGLFKKVVVADNAGQVVDNIFGTYQSQSGAVLWFGMFLFAFQIYGDFSGYTDIAIGVARLFGIRLMHNFRLPYFSRDIAEFWRRWHISLTTWFRDYVYIPMGGSRVSRSLIVRNTLVVFLLSGVWHGAKWNFLVWGLFHALLFIPLILAAKNRNNLDEIDSNYFLPNFKQTIQIFSTFLIVSLGWVFFRAETLNEAFLYFKGMFNINDFLNFETYSANNNSLSNYVPLFSLISIILLLLFEWFNRGKRTVFDFSSKFVRWFLYLFFCVIIYICMGSSSAFIYFQF